MKDPLREELIDYFGTSPFPWKYAAISEIEGLSRKELVEFAKKHAPNILAHYQIIYVDSDGNRYDEQGNLLSE